MKSKELFKKVRLEGRKNLTEFESREILQHYKIPVVKAVKSESVGEALKFARKVGYPVVLKVISPQVIHKTDVGGVALNIKNDYELELAYISIKKNVMKHVPQASIDGVLVQKMLENGYEVIIGGKKDQTFGQTIAFGLGGVFVEVFDDISFRVVPIDKKDALEMIKELKSYKLLKGYRGKKPADLKALVNILLKTSRLLNENPEIKELDINPVFALPEGAVAVDARIILE